MDDPSAETMRLLNGGQATQALRGATPRTADLLKEGPPGSDDRAPVTVTRPRSPKPDGQLSPLGRPEPIGAIGGPLPVEPMPGRPWGQSLHDIQAGENAFRPVHGTDVWTRRAQHPDSARSSATRWPAFPSAFGGSFPPSATSPPPPGSSPWAAARAPSWPKSWRCTLPCSGRWSIGSRFSPEPKRRCWRQFLRGGALRRQRLSARH